MRAFIRLKNYFPLILLFFIEVALFVTNYQHGTYFLGWDNLAPEFNLIESFRRSFFGIWQEYRGLGLLDGMSFAANLPHYLFIGFLAFFLPDNLLRYCFIFLTHFLGGVGIYFLIKELLEKYTYKKIAAFFGSLFYLFNIATVQMFFIPYEVFTVHFASLPILLLFTIKYLNSGKKKHLLWLSIVTVCSIPQGHVPTLFIVYSFALFAVLGFSLIQQDKVGIKRSTVVLLITICINAFWAFPYAYSTLQNAEIIANSKINQMGTEDIFRRNQAFGDLLDVVLLRGFALDFIDIKTTGVTGYMMEEWRSYAYSPLFVSIGIVIFLIALLASIKAIISRQKQFYPFILLFVFSFLMLGTTIPVLSIVSSFFYNYIPYFFQIFRFTFTKFSLLYAFSFSIMFAFGVIAILQLFEKGKYVRIPFIILLFVLIISSSFLSFRGYFFYPNLKTSVPQEYFALIDYFNKQDRNTRIALLPQPSFWGWTYNQWGYRGSGFIWFGLPQASLDGAFYPWSRQNENYYWEMTYAVYSGNVDLLDSVVKKYHINWLVVDHSITTQFSPKSLYLENLERLISQSGKMKLSASFGKINVYQVNLVNKPESFISVANGLPSAEPVYQSNNLDQAYRDIGDYRSEVSGSDKSALDIYYPFRSLFTGKTQEEHEFILKETNDSYLFEFQVPSSIDNAVLLLPAINAQDILEINIDNYPASLVRAPTIHVGSESIHPPVYAEVDSRPQDFRHKVSSGETIQVTIPKIYGFLSYSSAISDDLLSRNAYNCIGTEGESSFATSQLNNEKFFQLESNDTDLCYDVSLPNLPHRIAYLISISSRNKSGRPLILWLENQNSRRSDLETYLLSSSSFMTSYFIQPPMEYYGVGYTLHLQNHAIGQEKTINEVESIEVHPIPYAFLINMKVVDEKLNPRQFYYKDFEVDHPNPSLYYVTVNQENNRFPETLVLSQSYHEAWKAYVVDGWWSKTFPMLFGKELTNHEMVNNWANAWRIDPNILSPSDKQVTVAIIFWPQVLQYFGFALLPLPFVYALWPRKRNSKSPIASNATDASTTGTTSI